MDIKEIFQKRASMWVRYSGYEIVENDKGEGYIAPCSDASFTVYDPVDVSTELVSDALNAGRKIHDDESTANIRRTVLEFSRKYGSFGWMTALPMDQDFYKEKETYLGRNGALLGQKTMPTEKYIRRFLPFLETGEQEKAVPIAYTIGRGDIYDTVFSKGYGEPYIWLAGFLQHLFEHFFSVANANNPELSSDERTVLRHNAAAFDNHGMGFHLTPGTRPELKWEFDSLKTVLETAYCLYISDPASPLKMCKHCRKAYYNSNQRSEFCSGRCKNQWNVYKSRRKERTDG
jgi:hypothetical protein